MLTRPPSTSRTAHATRTRCAAASGAASASGACKATGLTTCLTTGAASAEYALANRVPHPLTVYIREDQLTGEVDAWLAREFAPHRLHKTIAALADAQFAEPLPRPDDEHEETALKIAECDRKLTGYRAALDAGASPATVVAWIADTEAEKARYLAARRPSSLKRRRMGEAEIKAIVDRLADLARVLADADPNDKSEIFRQLGLRLTYHPGKGLVKAEVMPAECGFFESVRGPRPTNWA